MKNVIKHAAPYRTGGNVYRVIIYRYDEHNKLLGQYEVWGTVEAMKQRLSDVKDTPTQEQLQRFAVNVYEERLAETNYEPKETGAFLTIKGVIYGDSQTFTDELNDEDAMLQTNISLPASLHEWVKIESAKTRKSLSEIIRIALEQYKNNRFTCSNCGKERQGQPYFQNGTEYHCRDCFLKAFENS